MVSEPNSSASILIVDPEECARKLAASVLRRGGYTTVEAESGEEALEIAQRKRPRVVILEVCLSGISGYEVCRELREAFGASVSIVFLSGARGESFDRVAGLMLGADDYLVKPFAADELLERVRSLIRRSPGVASGAASKLTNREHQVLQLLAQGLDQKEIASRLVVSPRTVGTHIEHIFAKLGVHSRSQAVALAYRDELVDPKFPYSLVAAPLAMQGSQLLQEALSACWLASVNPLPL
jgi:DNA-binding NarL/FixJ family response regulator